MREVVSYLKKLQQVDLEMLKVVKERDAFPAKVQELEGQLAEQHSQLQSRQQSFEKAKQERLEKHTKFKEDDDRLKKWERRLNDSKNAREASALAREIDAHKRLNSELEEEVLKLMETEEQQKKALDELKASIAALEESLAKERVTCEQNLAQLNVTVAQFEQDRQQYLQHLSKSILTRYEAVKKAKGGLALAAARNGCCTACNMRLRPQLYNTILKLESLETCPSCKRLLYCDEENLVEAS